MLSSAAEMVEYLSMAPVPPTKTHPYTIRRFGSGSVKLKRVPILVDPGLGRTEHSPRLFDYARLSRSRVYACF